MKITVGQVTKEQDIAAETTFLSVPWKIEDADAVLLEGIQAFPIDATEEQIRNFLGVTLANFKDKLAGAEASKAAQAALDGAEAVAGAVSNLEITE